MDALEPNNAKAAARAIANISDCDAVNSKSLTATIFPSGDEDWYRFRDTDDTGCDIYPDIQLSNIPSSTNLDLEVYFTCVNGQTPTKFECDVGSKLAGASGCRSANGGTNAERITVDACCTEDPVFGANCTGGDDGFLDIRVYKASGSDPTCEQSYTLSWGDD